MPDPISIHAPREGSDQLADEIAAWEQKFLSTLPARGATLSRLSWVKRCTISIHAPREGSDWRSTWTRWRNPISIHAPREGSDHPHGPPRV